MQKSYYKIGGTQLTAIPKSCRVSNAAHTKKENHYIMTSHCDSARNKTNTSNQVPFTTIKNTIV